MTSAIREARRIQIGPETVRGTAVAATRKILTRSATYRKMEELKDFDDQIHGTMARVVTPPVVTRNGTEFEITNDLDFEQILMFFLSGLVGGVTPSEPGTVGPAELWTFTPPIAADPLPDTYTIEFADRDMAASPNELSLESPYCFTTAIEITGGLEGVPEINASMVGRKAVTSASTAALALPATSYNSNLKWTVFFDDAWSGLGGTQILAQIYGFTWRVDGDLRPEYYLDGRGDLAFSQYEFSPRTADLVLDVVIDPDSGLVGAESALKTAGTRRFVRVLTEGAAFGTPDEAFNHHVLIDGCYTHASDSMQDRGDDRDGSAITRIHLQSSLDPVQSQDVEVSVQNTLTAFPA